MDVQADLEVVVRGAGAEGGEGDRGRLVEVEYEEESSAFKSSGRADHASGSMFGGREGEEGGSEEADSAVVVVAGVGAAAFFAFALR